MSKKRTSTRDFYEDYRRALMEIKPDPDFFDRMIEEIPKLAENRTWEEPEEWNESSEQFQSDIEPAKYKVIKPKKWLAVAACFVVLVGLGVALFPHIENFGLKNDLVITEAYAENNKQLMAFNLYHEGLGYDNEDYTSNILWGEKYFSFNFLCQGTEGDYVVYRFESPDISVVPEDPEFKSFIIPERDDRTNELKLPVNEPVRGMLLVKIDPKNEALVRSLESGYGEGDEASITNDALKTINGTNLTISCYENGEVIKENTFIMTCDYNYTDQDVIHEVGTPEPTVLVSLERVE